MREDLQWKALWLVKGDVGMGLVNGGLNDCFVC